jgi:hypothetical protein
MRYQMTVPADMELQLSHDSAGKCATIQLNVDGEPGAQVTAIVDPICRATSVPSNPNLVGMLLRHPELGWLSFALPKGNAQKLGESLVVLATAQPEPQATT